MDRKYIVKDGVIISISTTSGSDYGIDVNVKNIGRNIIDVLKESKAKTLRTKYQKQIDAISSNYAPYELESFTDQKAEWKLYSADNTASTPIVDAMATARGITRDALFTKIGTNITAIATLQGQQNATEDAIKACTTLAELDAIVV